MKTHVLLALMLSVLWVRPPALGAEEPAALKTVEAIGTVRIQGEKIVDAREAAISSGLAAAVERTILGMIPPEAAAANFSTITELFSSNVSQYVQGYKVLAESRSGGFYRVLVQAGVFSGAIQKQLGTIGSMNKKILPSVLVMVSEQRPGSADFQYGWGPGPASARPPGDLLLSRIFEEKGYPITGLEGASGADALSAVRMNPNPGNSQIAEIGTRSGADMVLAGTIAMKRLEPAQETDPQKIHITLSLRVVRSGSGDQIAVFEQTADASGTGADAMAIDQTLTQLSGAAGDELSRQMAASWQKQTLKSDAIELQVEGTSQLGNFTAFRSVLNRTMGVKSVQIKEMKADKSILLVEYPNGTRPLADALLSKTYEGFGITIPEVTENRMKVVLINKSQQ